MGRGQQTSEVVGLRRSAARGDAPTVRTRLYRSGELSKVETFPAIEEINGVMDEFCPQGRVGRSEGLFCSAALTDLGRWTAANMSCRYPYQPRELSYAGPEPYVYPIGLYEYASATLDSYKHLRELGDPRWEEWVQMANDYWESGVPLNQFLEQREDLLSKELWKDGHEILISPEHISSHRHVSWKRLMNGCQDDRYEREFRRQMLADARSARWERKNTARAHE